MFRLATISLEGVRNRVRVGGRRTAALALLAVAAALVPAAAAQSRPAQVVATVGMIGDVAAEIAGECAEVTVMMGPGVDPHLYQATSGDVRDLSRADLILYGGLSLEGQLGDVLDRFGARTPTLAVSEAGVAPADRVRTSSAYGVDPHVWMDVALWSGTIDPIADALAEVVPDCDAALRERAERYRTLTRALHAWIEDATATVPEGHRVLVTAHDAFEYFGRAYGFDVVGIQGVSTESEASVADIRATAETIASAGVPAVFVETTINPRTVEAVLAAAERMGAAAELGGSLYADAMGEPGTPDGTYLGMLRANTVSIVAALGGEVPPLPPELAPWAERFGLETAP